jgi:hypothetical protein
VRVTFDDGARWPDRYAPPPIEAPLRAALPPENDPLGER